MVEDADLTVRLDRVYIKTLEGLKQVDAIIRRIPDWDCDPLFCDSRSSTGIPGLMEVVRANRVLIVNTIGSGALEAPMIAPFLPELCRCYLAEDFTHTNRKYLVGVEIRKALSYSLNNLESFDCQIGFSTHQLSYRLW